jgi:putative ABC transport system permease protein
LFRREWRQQLLVLALLTVVVAAAVTGSTLAVNAGSDSKAVFGDADLFAVLDGADRAAADAGVAVLRQQYGTVEVVSHADVAVPGSAEPLDLRGQDPDGPLSAPTVELLEGRYPRTAGEVALTEGAAALFSADVGDTVEFDGADFEVVGAIENPTLLDDEFALVAPDAGVEADTLTVLVESMSALPGTGNKEIPALVSMSGNGNDVDATTESVLLLVATTLVLSLVALVAAAGFVVVAQRRQRQLGLLSAIGATTRQIRLVMLANGAIVGAVAGVVGGLLGIVGWLATSDWAETAANHRIDTFALPWGMIAATMMLAIVMATAAAWWPGRIVSRLSVMAALSGRPSRPLPVHRSLVLAGALVVGGVAAIAAAQPTSNHVRPLVLIAGLVAVVVGVVFVSPAAIRVLPLAARRLPFAPRLALRDLARYQARAAAALAAITLGLGVCVAIVAIAKANEYRSDEGNLSSHQILVTVAEPERGPKLVLTASEQRQLDAGAATVAESLGDDATSLALDFAVNPATSGGNGLLEPIVVGQQFRPDEIHGFDVPFVATSDVLTYYGIDPATIDDATDLLTVHKRTVGLYDFSVRGPTNAPTTAVQHVDLPPYGSAPRSLVTEAAMERHGWQPARRAWLVESQDPLSSAQIAAARDAAADAGVAIEVREKQDGLGALRTGATTVGALLAIAIVLMAIGLLRSESAGDLRTLTATGAAARTRRALTASTAGALALLGAMLGIAGAYIALVAGYHATLEELSPLPVTHLLVLAIGLPLAATAAGWLFAGREPRGFARQAIE